MRTGEEAFARGTINRWTATQVNCGISHFKYTFLYFWMASKGRFEDRVGIDSTIWTSALMNMFFSGSHNLVENKDHHFFSRSVQSQAMSLIEHVLAIFIQENICMFLYLKQQCSHRFAGNSKFEISWGRNCSRNTFLFRPFGNRNSSTFNGPLAEWYHLDNWCSRLAHRTSPWPIFVWTQRTRSMSCRCLTKVFGSWATTSSDSSKQRITRSCPTKWTPTEGKLAVVFSCPEFQWKTADCVIILNTCPSDVGRVDVQREVHLF